MTTPQLSIAVNEDWKSHIDAGRFYKLPGSNIPNTLSLRDALPLIKKDFIFPSITNVIGGIGPNLAGWEKHMMAQDIFASIREGNGDSLSDIVKRAKEAAPLYTQYACDKGTEVHAACEEFLENAIVPSKEYWQFDGEAYFNGFLAFMEKYQPEVIGIEQTVYGRTIFGKSYAGTMDAILKIDGKVYAADWKTSKSIHHEVALQTAAGINAKKITNKDFTALEDMPHIDGAIGVHLKHNGEFSVHETTNIEKSWENFCHIREAWEVKVFNGALREEPLKEW